MFSNFKEETPVMKKIDINKFNNIKDVNNGSFKKKAVFKIIKRALITIMTIFLITGIVVLASASIYIMNLSNDVLDYDFRATKLHLTSFVYANDENGNPYEYQRIYNTENRIWVDFGEIPDYMKNAAIAIEDKRFYDHRGVDIIRTAGAMLSLFKGKGNSYGGSTITQQLIKNLTEDNEVSLTRKLREIFRALNFEKKYSKDEILEAYLNIVNFGSGCRGVQAAANVYFGKDIKDCSIAQCACIAGITQNPSAFNPFYYPEKNKQRRDVIIKEMFEQGMISKDEYNEAIIESENMSFKDQPNNNENKSQTSTRNWYIEALYKDLVNDLSEKLGIGTVAAEEMILTQGLKIYSAMDPKAQEIAESVIRDDSIMPKDKELDLGYVMMGFDGRILATIGCREEKTGDLWYDKANTARRQPGSTIKPIAVYTPAIDLGIYNYSSLIPDQPLQVDVTGNGVYKNWPENWYKSYKGFVTLQWAIEKSANAPSAQVLNTITPKASYNFLKDKLGFYSLDPKDGQSLAPLATGGTHVGVTVREMTAAFQIYGNGGIYHKPYTYYYVLDKDDNMILDNRNSGAIQSINPQTATIMNRLLRNVVIGPEGTGRAANISGWNVIGKTGTTNDDYDSWFIGETPYAVAGIWTGYDNPKRIKETGAAIRIWKAIMTKYLADKPQKDYTYDSKVVEALYNKSTGKIVSSSSGANTAIGYYSVNNIAEMYSFEETNENDTSSEPEAEAVVNTKKAITVEPKNETLKEKVNKSIKKENKKENQKQPFKDKQNDKKSFENKKANQNQEKSSKKKNYN